MLMARPVPLQFTAGADAPTVAREGYVSLTVIPRTPTAEDDDKSVSKSFDKENKISVKLRAKQIGQLIAWKPSAVGGRNGASTPSLVINTFLTGSVPVTIDMRPAVGEEGMIQVTVTPKGADQPAPVSLPVSIGEIRAFQVLLEACLPDLYGWVGKETAPRVSGTWSRSTEESTKSPEDFFNQFK